jgi:ubiquinol-cytochrome c reductase cytochrome c1 subunit
MTNRILASLVALMLGFAALSVHASGAGGLMQSHVNLGDQASLQRGAKYFMNYCAGCHSLGYQRYSRMAEDLGLTEEEVQTWLNFSGAKFGDVMKSAMAPGDGVAFFGKAPPDLSLVARAKPGGPDWTYTFLKSFYVDETRPSGWNNTLLPGASMPNVLWDLQGTQRAVYEQSEHGESHIAGFEIAPAGRISAAEYDSVVRDITNFLNYVGEPAAMKREAIGIWVVLFLAVFTFIAWLLKAEFWRDIH